MILNRPHKPWNILMIYFFHQNLMLGSKPKVFINTFTWISQRNHKWRNVTNSSCFRSSRKICLLIWISFRFVRFLIQIQHISFDMKRKNFTIATEPISSMDTITDLLTAHWYWKTVLFIRSTCDSISIDAGPSSWKGSSHVVSDPFPISVSSKRWL